MIKHDIKLIDGAKPHKQKYRSLPPPLEEELKKQLDQWLEEGIIESSTSPWSSNVVPVKKKSGSIRFCLDFRQVNAVTEKDAFPLPLIKECTDRIAGSSIFSSVDVHSAFNAITVTESARPITAFSTPFGLYQMPSLGFGLCYGPASYC